jgi:hypothetical protein
MSRYGEVALGVESALPARFELRRRRRRSRAWLVSGMVGLLLLAGLSLFLYTDHGGGREARTGSVVPVSSRSPALATGPGSAKAARRPAVRAQASK